MLSFIHAACLQNPKHAHATCTPTTFLPPVSVMSEDGEIDDDCPTITLELLARNGFSFNLSKRAPIMGIATSTSAHTRYRVHTNAVRIATQTTCSEAIRWAAQAFSSTHSLPMSYSALYEEQCRRCVREMREFVQQTSHDLRTSDAYEETMRDTWIALTGKYLHSYAQRACICTIDCSNDRNNCVPVCSEHRWYACSRHAYMHTCKASRETCKVTRTSSKDYNVACIFSGTSLGLHDSAVCDGSSFAETTASAKSRFMYGLSKRNAEHAKGAFQNTDTSTTSPTNDNAIEEPEELTKFERDLIDFANGVTDDAPAIKEPPSEREETPAETAERLGVPLLSSVRDARDAIAKQALNVGKLRARSIIEDVITTLLYTTQTHTTIAMRLTEDNTSSSQSLLDDVVKRAEHYVEAISVIDVAHIAHSEYSATESSIFSEETPDVRWIRESRRPRIRDAQQCDRLTRNILAFWVACHATPYARHELFASRTTLSPNIQGACTLRQFTIAALYGMSEVTGIVSVSHGTVLPHEIGLSRDLPLRQHLVFIGISSKKTSSSARIVSAQASVAHARLTATNANESAALFHASSAQQPSSSTRTRMPSYARRRSQRDLLNRTMQLTTRRRTSSGSTIQSRDRRRRLESTTPSLQGVRGNNAASSLRRLAAYNPKTRKIETFTERKMTPEYFAEPMLTGGEHSAFNNSDIEVAMRFIRSCIASMDSDTETRYMRNIMK